MGILFVCCYLYQCDCGAQKEAAASNVRAGSVRSCGCMRREVSKVAVRHGHTVNATNSPEYRCWQSMMNRCRNINLKCYPRYGGRGITVCERWQTFENFLVDMGSRPSTSHSVERANVNGNYEPDNCRWATSKEQAANRCDTVMIEHGGRSMILADWAREFGMAPGTIRRRMLRGATFEQATTTPRGTRLELAKRAKRRTAAEMAAAYGHE